MEISVYTNQGLKSLPASTLDTVSISSDEVIWINIPRPTPEVMEQLQNKFDFHPLAIEDTLNQRQRPKIDEYNNHLLIITNHILQNNHAMEFYELDIFLGRSYIITVHEQCQGIVEEVRRRIERSGSFKLVSSEFLLYVLLDTVVDSYFPVVDKVDDELEDLGDLVIHNPSHEVLERLLKLKRMLSEMWHVVEQQQGMFSTLTRREHDILTHHDVLEYYLRDVHDHLIRITNITNILRDNLTSIIELYLSSESYRLNRVVNRLTVITIIIGVFTVFGGIYGMNFTKTWPPFDADWGVPFVLSIMLLLSAGILLLFKRMRWL